MTQNKKPVPAIQPWTRKFWEAVKDNTLFIQKCKDCDSNIFFPKKVCPECWSENLRRQEACGKTEVFTFTTMLAMVEPVFIKDLPYVIAMVDLEEGIRMTTRIVNCNPDDVKIGMDVEARGYAFDDYKLGERTEHESLIPEGLIRAPMPLLYQGWR